jgi:hypothetical protein
LSKLFSAYHKKLGVEEKTYKFYFDGNALNENQIVGEVFLYFLKPIIDWI